MAHSIQLASPELVGWPKAIEVWHFDRSKGSTNIGLRKKTQPCKVNAISAELKELQTKEIVSREDTNGGQMILPFSSLPLNFCKKDAKTGLQKQLRCQACKCLMESTNALKAHLNSQKHQDNFHDYEKYDCPDENSKLTRNSNVDDLGNNCSDTNSSSLKAMSLKRKYDKIPVLDEKRRKTETKGERNKKITDRPGFGQDKYDETSYYFDFEKSLRKVYPYYFTFTTFTKGRWVGEGILDVFSREFRAHSSDEYRRCIDEGKLTVNGKKVNIDYKLEHNDMLANVVHRHEVPVTSNPIRIIHIDQDLVVIDKPPSIPVHPCGRYRYNTVAYILAKEHNLKFLKTIHRLDRLTSGVLMFGRTPKKAHEMEQQIRSRNVQKMYLCLVEGEFPLSADPEKDSKTTSNVVSCSMPIEVVSHKIGVCRVSPEGKHCHTDFERLSFDGKNSVVLCRPHTGRMHQIRVHLQYLGYPIINDPLYNSPAFGPNKGKGGDIGGKTYHELIQELIRLHSAENWLEFESNKQNEPRNVNITPGSDKGNPNDEKQEYILTSKSELDIQEKLIDQSDIQTPSVIARKTCQDPKLQNFQESTIKQEYINENENSVISSKQPAFNPNKVSKDDNCKECTMNYSDPTQEQLIMFLHAYRYSGDGWTFETKLPSWTGINEIPVTSNL